MRTRGSAVWAKSYVIVENKELIFSETPVEKIQEQMQSENENVWIDISAWITEKVIPIEKKLITSYGAGEELKKWKSTVCIK